jgi:3',5'-cyclic AMP phosphodiesterase CpdA
MTTPSILAQLSDLHIREPGRLAYGRVDTAGCLQRAVSTLCGLKQAPDAVVITGDLTDFGRPAEYEHLARLLAPLAMPVFLLPGNHDDREQLRRSFPAHGYLGREGFIQYAADIGGLCLIALDTCVPLHSHGTLCAERLAWLEAQLALCQGRPVIIAMHHPPFDTGIGHMDEIGLQEGAAALEAIVARNAHVERIVCGHLHRAIDVRFGGSIASTAPSTAHQVCLDLAPDAPSAWALEPPGLRLHVLPGRGRVVTHTVPVGVFEGPHPFHADGLLID